VTEIHNVHDRHRAYIGPWKVEPLDYDKLTEADIGRTVIYRDHGRAERGILTSYRDGRVWARYSTGDTAAAADPESLVFGIEPLA